LSAVVLADSPFDGKSLAGWKLRGDQSKSKWKVGTATVDAKNTNQFQFRDDGSELVNLVDPNKKGDRSVDIYTEQKYGDCTVEVEFMIPKGSNSGVYLMGEYELQIYDTFDKKGKDPKPGDMAGIYTFAPAKVFADKGPGQWQKFVIDFQAPKFEGGKKVSNAKFIKVTFNDVVIHENVECDKPTPSGITGKEAPEGPLMFQGDHGPVAFRNIKVTKK
jgi:Domain of Unknown Function (DUF1080)